MKEAAGEANMTVITIVLITIVLLVGGVIVNNIMHNTETKSNATTNANKNCSWNATTSKYDCN